METTQESKSRSKKNVRPISEDAPSLGVLEGDILRLLWNAGEPQTSVQVYEAMHFSRRAEKREMQSPSTIAVTLSRMVEKGLLTVERRPTRGGKGYYAPTQTREEVVARVLDDVSRRLTGQTLGYLLTQLRSDAPRTGQEGAKTPDDGLEAVITELKRVRAEKNQFSPLPKVPEY